MSETQIPTTPNLSTRLRQVAARQVDRLGEALYRWGVHPDVLTVLGLCLVVLAAALMSQGAFGVAALVLMVGLPLDALDGAVARAMKRTNPFGGVLDSTIDRYADLLMLLALAYYCAVRDMFGEMVLVFGAVVGSTLVSYIRARAGNAGLPCAGGWFSRFERSAVLILTLLTGWLLPGLLILAVGSNLTALQRLWSVYRFAQTDSKGK